jgi:hypothetical protein
MTVDRVLSGHQVVVKVSVTVTPAKIWTEVRVEVVVVEPVRDVALELRGVMVELRDVAVEVEDEVVVSLGVQRAAGRVKGLPFTG